MEKEMPDACVAQLVRAADRQYKDPGLNPTHTEKKSWA